MTTGGIEPEPDPEPGYTVQFYAYEPLDPLDVYYVYYPVDTSKEMKGGSFNVPNDENAEADAELPDADAEAEAPGTDAVTAPVPCILASHSWVYARFP